MGIIRFGDIEYKIEIPKDNKANQEVEKINTAIVRFRDIEQKIEIPRDNKMNQDVEKINIKESECKEKINTDTIRLEDIENKIEIPKDNEEISTQKVKDNSSKDKFKLVKIDMNKIETPLSCLYFNFSDFNNKVSNSQIVMKYYQNDIETSYNLRWLTSYDLRWLKDKYKIKIQIRYIDKNSSNLFLKIEDNKQIVYMKRCIISNEYEFNTIRFIIKDIKNNIKLKNIKINGIKIENDIRCKTHLEVWDMTSEKLNNIKEGFSVEYDLILSKNSSYTNTKSYIEILLINK